MRGKEKTSHINLLASSKEYFTEVVSEALVKRRIETPHFVSQYLVDLLDTNIATENSTMNQTFAEAVLKAFNSEKSVRHEMLKRVGDTSLYISGVFGDSLRRKIVDVDYYAEIGGLAYGRLATELNDDTGQVFYEFSNRFLDYVDVLAFVGQNSGLQTNQDLLRLYERYVATGSQLAKEQLVELGLLTNIDKDKIAQ